MASDIEIANRALTKLGGQTLLALTDDTKEGRALSGQYEMIRDDELRRHPWNFAVKRASLAALVGAPVFGFGKQYQLPSDCLRPIQIGEWWMLGTAGTTMRGGGQWAELWQIEGRQILTDLSAPLNIRYIARITDPAQYDPTFVEAFACRLAYDLCEAITQSNGRKAGLMDEYAEAIRSARQMDSFENPPVEAADDSWINARR